MTGMRCALSPVGLPDFLGHLAGVIASHHSEVQTFSLSGGVELELLCGGWGAGIDPDPLWDGSREFRRSFS